MFVSALFKLSLLALPAVAGVVRRGDVAYYNPANGGGSMLDNAGDGLGEPLNVRMSSGQASFSSWFSLGYYLWRELIRGTQRSWHH